MDGVGAAIEGWFGASDAEIARQVLQRGVAACFVVAFVSTMRQFPALLGERGLLPAPRLLAYVRFRQAPSVFHLHYSDRLLLVLCGAGAAVAAALALGVPQAAPRWFGLDAVGPLLPMAGFLFCWAVYLSVVDIGQTFYAFGWESLLLEAGFVVAFLGSDDVAPPVLVLLFLRWLVFRLEFGAGMIKIRGGREWRDLTALDYHHETQPMPGPLSWQAHRAPRWWHRVEVLGNHAVQLVVPWFLFAPQPLATIAALLIALTQTWLVVTGNFSWLNAITIVLAFSAVSDAALGAHTPAYGSDPVWFAVLVLPVVLGLAALSIRPLLNLFARHQLMNASFNAYHLVNAYGAFGTVTTERYEVILEGTAEDEPYGGWREYEFPGKPGDPMRRPPQVAPYHHRLGWLLWFLALGSPDSGWFRMLLVRLLEGDSATRRLLRVDPFPDAPPRWIRARVFLYRFTTREERRRTGAWWVREPVGTLAGPVALPREE